MSVLRAATLALLALSLCGQDFRATVTGQVTDASGAALPDAKIRAVRRSTNQTTEVATPFLLDLP